MEIKGLRSEEIYLKFLKYNPPNGKYVPTYQFLVFKNDDTLVGECELRIGMNDLIYLAGNIGYKVYEEHRGNHYAGKACKILFEFAKKNNAKYLIITCDPENIASQKTCEYVECDYLETVNVPKENIKILKGSTRKCIFRKIL